MGHEFDQGVESGAIDVFFHRVVSVDTDDHHPPFMIAGQFHGLAHHPLIRLRACGYLGKIGDQERILGNRYLQGGLERVADNSIMA